MASEIPGRFIIMPELFHDQVSWQYAAAALVTEAIIW
jgi:hypothetical protein